MRLNDILLNKRNSCSGACFLKFIFLGLSILLIITSCEESSFIGLEVLPDSDRFIVRNYTDNEISTSVVTRDSLPGLNQSRSLLGEINDPLFGIARASFMTQVGISAVDYNFGTDPRAESLILYLYIAGNYGNILTPQTINIYEVNEVIDTAMYYTNLDPVQMTFHDQELASYNFTPASTDTIIAVPITDAAFKEKLLFAPDSAKASIGQFISYVNGLYVTSSVAGEPGSIFSINLSHDYSQLSLFYSNAENPDTTLRFNYIIPQDANRINIVDNDYSTAVFFDQLGQTGGSDPLYYVQGNAGVMTRLNFDNLQAWNDSVPVSINSARLILPVDSSDQTAESFPVPPRLSLLEMDDKGALLNVIDIDLGDSYFGGLYNQGTEQYTFNVTNFIQAVIRGKKTNNFLYLTVRDSGLSPNRAVLRSNNHPLGGPRLDITYTKH